MTKIVKLKGNTNMFVCLDHLFINPVQVLNIMLVMPFATILKIFPNFNIPEHL